MLVSSKIFENLCNCIAKEEIEKGQQCQLNGNVKLKNIKYENAENFSLTSIVDKNNNVELEIKDNKLENYKCSCKKEKCSHLVATLYELDLNEKYENSFNLSNKIAKNHEKNEKNEEKLKYLKANNFITKFKENIFEEKKTVNDLLENDELLDLNYLFKIIPRIDYTDKEKVRLSFSIANEFYTNKIKDLFEFIQNIENKSVCMYGTKLKVKHDINNFDEDSKILIKFIENYVKGINQTRELIESSNLYYSFPKIPVTYITLQNDILDDFIKLLINKKISYKQYNMAMSLDLDISTNYLKLFNLEKEINGDYSFSICHENSNFNLIKSNKKLYFIDKTKNLLLVNNKNVKLEEIYNYLSKNTIIFSENNINDFFTVIYPKIRNYLQMDYDKFSKYLPKELATKIYLDLNENNDITLKLEFCYGDKCFNPLKDNNLNIVRNLNEEQSVYNIILSCGFIKNVEDSCYMLFDDNKIYEFLSYKINLFMEKFEVLITEKFKTKQIKQPKIGNLGIKLESKLLNIDFSKLNFDISEFKEVMNAYSLKIKYYKLKDGSYLNLENSEELEVMNDLITSLDIKYKDIMKGTIQVPMYRSLYLERLLNKSKTINIDKDENYRNIIDDIENSRELDIKLPERLNNVLREYQKSGFKWLKTLDYYGFGGILADDMGLR